MLFSCFQGVMGEAYVDDIDNPKSAIILVNAFAFASGKPNYDFVKEWYDERIHKFIIITAREEEWNKVFEKVGKDKCRRVERYAIKKEKDCFNEELLKGYVNNLSSEYELRIIDEAVYNECQKHEWSVDLAEDLGYHYSHTYTAYEMWK